MTDKPIKYAAPQILQTANPDEFLPPLGQWTTLGGMVMLSGLVAAVGLSAILKYDGVVKAPMVVRPTGELRLVQSPIEGRVKQIELKENQQHVTQGEILAFLDDSQLQTQKKQLQNTITQNRRQQDQLNAQIRALDEQMMAETEQQKRTVAVAKAQLRLNQRDYRDQSVTATTEVQQARANLQRAKEDWHKAQAELKVAQSELNSTAAAVQAAIAKRDRYQIVANSGALSQDQLAEAKLAAKQQQETWQAQQAMVEAQQKNVARQEQEIIAAKAQLKQTKVSLNPSNADVGMAQEQVAQQHASGASTLANLKREREQLLQESVQLQNQLSRDRQELQQVETDLTKTAIAAPISGTLQTMNLRNISQVVQVGEEIAKIAPKNSSLEVKALIASQDISQVSVGMPVKMRISACPYPDFGVLSGTVKTVAPDAVTDADSNRGSSTAALKQPRTYTVSIDPTHSTLVAGGRNCAIQSGMEGRADIIAQQESVLRFVLRKARLLIHPAG